ncbi:hydroxymyristoyl-ACP dehydratase [Lysinibacillus sp. FSL K6-0232]|uniref:hydroxymyristoyl-ACP dehydratase n=1 Tax=unclassified Lysinibacillus TaxID=2636778 RepID=UPI0030F78833
MITSIDNEHKLLRPEQALDKDFCDQFIKKMHKNILDKKLHHDVYTSYFVILQQRYTVKELDYIVGRLKQQANELLRLKPMFILLSGMILAIFTLLAAVMSMLIVEISLLQIVALAVVSLSIAILAISYKIEKEYKRAQAVINLLTYYRTIEQATKM